MYKRQAEVEPALAQRALKRHGGFEGLVERLHRSLPPGVGLLISAKAASLKPTQRGKLYAGAREVCLQALQEVSDMSGHGWPLVMESSYGREERAEMDRLFSNGG